MKKEYGIRVKKYNSVRIDNEIIVIDPGHEYSYVEEFNTLEIIHPEDVLFFIREVSQKEYTIAHPDILIDFVEKITQVFPPEYYREKRM